LRKLIIEARVNEYMMREQGNPNVPYSPDEIARDAVACREAGAAVLHFHARKADGSPEHAIESYAETVGLIRARSDILVHPTLGYVTLDQPAERRLDHIIDMAKDPSKAPHFAPMDMGSVNVDRYNAQARRFETDDLVYKNSTRTLTYFAEHIRAAGLKPYLVSWTIGFTRYVGAFLDMGLLDEPAYLCFCLTDNTFLGGHPGTLKGLQAHLDFLPRAGTSNGRSSISAGTCSRWQARSSPRAGTSRSASATTPMPSSAGRPMQRLSPASPAWRASSAARSPRPRRRRPSSPCTDPRHASIHACPRSRAGQPAASQRRQRPCRPAERS
jgi:3-keto-5-aminohexanoate cleavage enzyme